MTSYRRALLAQLDAELAARTPPPSSSSRPPFDPAALLYDQQFRRVSSVLAARDRLEKHQAWPAGRRSGKTDAATKLLLKVAGSRPGTQTFFVSTSIKRAAATCWDELVRLNQDHQIGGIPNQTTHTLTFPGAGKLVVTGVENKRMANDLRGRPKVAGYFVDEAQDWPDDLLRYFYEQVVFPSLADVQGFVIFAGTGGAPRGFWYEVATRDPGFTRHPAWTPHQNPYLPTGEAAALIAKACADRGCDETDPSIRREFYAEFVVDTKRQIFPVAEANKFARGRWDPGTGWWVGGELPAAPPKDWSIVLGNDFGTVDKAAWVAIGWVPTDPRLWMLETDAQDALGSGAQVAQVLEVAKRYERVGNVYVVGDPGGGGKSHIVTLRQEHWLPIEGAEKADKAAACLALRGGLRSTKVVVARQEPEFIDEIQRPEWDPNAIGRVIKGHMPDRVDAALYGYRKAIGLHHYVEPKASPTREQRELDALLTQQTAEETAMRELGLLQ